MDNNARMIRSLCFVPAHIPERTLDGEESCYWIWPVGSD